MLGKRGIFLFIWLVLVTALTFLSLGKALEFHFWRDDWVDLWDLTYHPEVSFYFDNGITLRRHPGLAVEKVIGNKIFGQDIFNWQIFGIILRILDSLAVAAMMFGLTKSKKAAVLSSLFMAVAIGGLESVTWISAHTTALFIFFLCIGMYFWASSLDTPKRKLGNFIIALIVLSIAVGVTPAPGLVIIPVLALWDFLSWVRAKTRGLFQEIIIRNLVAGLILFTAINVLSSKLNIFRLDTLSNTFISATSNLSLVKNYFSSLGNLLTSWFLPVEEPISLGLPTETNFTSAMVFVFITLTLIIMLLLKRSRRYQVGVFLACWMMFFFLPSWLYEKTLVVGSSHRYLAIATVALVSLVTVFLYESKKLITLFSLLFVILNIIAANRLLGEIMMYRSYKTVQHIWDQIDQEVEPNQKDLIFVYLGSDLVWMTSMNWSGSIPFGIKRRISNPDDLPIVTGDKKLIADLLCKTDVYRPSVGGWSTQRNRIPISHLYAWRWQDGTLTNISEVVRTTFIKEIPCKVLP